ncbi:MAG: dNTP triphosphohydrolase [Desulfobacteraceae bacterium]|jgi:dGTPase
MDYDKDTKKFAKELESKIDAHKFRLHAFTDIDAKRERNEYMRDYARVLYSSSFRRLQSKMQLLGIDNTNFHRNRLTHSLEVAQIARGIACELGLKDTIVAETASLAHDIGNPPFGHSGEIVLDELASDIGGFEGNAQTLRILNRLEKKHHNYQGLNLTFRTIMSVIKYFQTKEDGVKKFIYKDDYDIISLKIEEIHLDHNKTIDCQIMDLADEIAYAAHDLDDTLSSGLLNIHELLYEFKINEKYSLAYDHLCGLVTECVEFADNAYRLKSSEEYSYLFRKELTSKIVNTLIWDIKVIEEEKGKKRLGFSKYKLLSNGLKKLLFKSLLRKPSVQLYEKRGEKIINGLFNVYDDHTFNTDLKLLPPEYRDLQSDDTRKRSIVDYISGMMDSFAVAEYIKYYGENDLNKMYFKSS